MSRPLGFPSPTQPAPEPRAAPEALVRSLERSQAQVEAGMTVKLEPALDRLRASIARMKAKPAASGQN